MADRDHRDYTESDRQRVVEEAIRAGQRAAEALRKAKGAQRSAAESLGRSAEAHDRTAEAYEDAADHCVGLEQDEFRARAARHRGFAREDRQIAQKMRENF